MIKETHKKFAKGFTLIELLVVVLIIGILAAIALPQYKMTVLKSKYARAKQTASDIRKAYELYYAIHNEYPTKFSQLDFANKFDDSSYINTSGKYKCNISDREIFCNADNMTYRIDFYKFDTKKITTQCRANTTNTSDIYNKLCQEETGITSKQANCNLSNCRYNY